MTAKRYEVVVHGGLVVTGQRISRQDVAIQNGKIVALETGISVAADREIDAKGKYVLPGIIDAHTHPLYVDDAESLAISAAYGGVTTLIYYVYADHGKQVAPPIRDFVENTAAHSVLDFGVHAGLFDPAHQAEEIPGVIDLGVTSFKLFMAYARLGRLCDEYQLLRVFDIIARAGGMGMVHAESGLATDYLTDKFHAEGRDPAEFFERMRPGVLEAEAVNRAAAIAQVAGCPLYIPHVSSHEAVEVVACAKRRGQRIFGETCPQYLALTNEEINHQGPLAKIGPPLRYPEDQRALWRGLSGGLIDTVGSDHAPKEKGRNDDFLAAAYGSPQVETMLSVMYQAGINQGHLTLPRLVQVMCENPARIFGLYPKKGAFLIGSDADLIVFDPGECHQIAQETQHSRASYTLYEGFEVIGKPVLSMQRGRVLLEGDELHALPRQGEFVRTQSGTLHPRDLLDGKGK